MEIKCNMKKPRSFFEDKLRYYLNAYEEAKEAGDDEKAHKLRSNVYQCRARLRYWDSHKEEYWAYVDAKTAEINDKNLRKLKVKLKKRIAEKKQIYKEANDYDSWHKCCAMYKAVDKQPANILLEVCEKLNIKLNNVD